MLPIYERMGWNILKHRSKAREKCRAFKVPEDQLPVIVYQYALNIRLNTTVTKHNLKAVRLDAGSLTLLQDSYD